MLLDIFPVLYCIKKKVRTSVFNILGTTGRFYSSACGDAHRVTPRGTAPVWWIRGVLQISTGCATVTLTKSSSPSTRPEDGSIAPSMVVLLNTPLILLPMRLIPKDSPLFDVFLRAKSGTMTWMLDGTDKASKGTWQTGTAGEWAGGGLRK